MRSKTTAPPSATWETLFSFTTELGADDSFNAALTGSGATLRWIVNGNTVVGDSVSGQGSAFGLDATPRTVEAQILGLQTISPTLIDLDDLAITGYFNLTNINFNTNNQVILLDGNGFTSPEVAQFLVYFDTNSTSGTTGREINLAGTNDFIYPNMTPNDGSQAQTNLVGKGWTVTVNGIQHTATLTLNLLSTDTVNVVVDMPSSSGSAKYVLPDGSNLDNNTLNGSAGSYGFDGTPQELTIYWGSGQLVTMDSLSAFNQKLSDFTLPDGLRIYKANAEIDFGGNSATLSNEDAIWKLADRHGETLTPANDGMMYANLRSQDIDTINRTTGNWYFTRGIQMFVDIAQETWSYPTFPSGYSSSDIIIYCELPNALELEADTDDVSAIVDHTNRVLYTPHSPLSGNRAEKYGTGGKGVSPIISLKPESSAARYQGYFDIVETMPQHNAVANRVRMATGTVILDADQNGTNPSVSFVDGGTPDLFTAETGSGLKTVFFDPEIGSSFTLETAAVGDQIRWFQWDFPNNIARAKTASGELITHALSGYSSSYMEFSTVYMIISSEHRYALMVLNQYLSETDADTLLSNIQSKTY